MDLRHLCALLCVMLLSCHVSSFSISSRQERSTDLAEALAILQRQRRRVDARYLDTDSLLGGPALTLDDVSDWLGPSRDSLPEELSPDWTSAGQFKDFRPELDYNLPMDNAPPTVPMSVKPSREELEDIFGDEIGDSIANSKSTPALDQQPEKKKKEEMINVKGDKKIVQKKSAPPPIVGESTGEGSLSLDTLTKDEFRALMKAVGKLQKQALKLGDAPGDAPAAKVTVIDSVSEEEGPEEVAIVQPVSQEELQSVFEDEDEKPVTEEAEVIVEEMPGTSGEKMVKEEVVAELSPQEAEEIEETEKELSQAIASELEDDITEEAARQVALQEAQGDIGADNLATIQKYWLMNKYLAHGAPQKRAAKRAVGLLPAPVQQLGVRPVSERPEEGDLELGVSPPTLERFVAKIVELQSEVDRLRMVSRLEDLENDVLTDALNEATLVQREGTVSDMEFQSIQQAIRIEEALQDLKKSEGRSQDSPDVSKRGEPWWIKRGSKVEVESQSADQEDVPAYSLSPYGSKVTKDDIQRLLGETYLMKAREAEEEENEEEEGPVVASLFMSHADQCPAVQEYSTNCQLADLYSLPVDFEARSLCNLHEMCYACGYSLQVSQDHCDLVYRAAATALCQEKENCVLESEIFLRTMKLKTRYIPHSQPLCRSTCTARFLGIL